MVSGVWASNLGRRQSGWVRSGAKAPPLPQPLEFSTEPDEEETTDLGKIPHEPRQGTNNTYPGSTAAYGLVGFHYE